ncbi:MAG: hypothetical protein MK101_03020 [Phycisphaerales bacterium]|nr:hypothetical protein [Phycisphaerales bacterium]
MTGPSDVLTTSDASHVPRLARVAPLSLVALVMAIIPLCPPLNLIAVVLGCVALRQVSRSGGALRGRGASFAAIVIGLAVGAASWWAWADTATWMERAFRREAATVTDGFFKEVLEPGVKQADIAKFWPDGRVPDAASIDQFALALQAAGPVTSIQVVGPQAVGGMSGDLSSAVQLDTPAGLLNGGVSMQIVIGGSGVPGLRATLTSVSVHLPDGDIKLEPGEGGS